MFVFLKFLLLSCACHDDDDNDDNDIYDVLLLFLLLKIRRIGRWLRSLLHTWNLASTVPPECVLHPGINCRIIMYEDLKFGGIM